MLKCVLLIIKLTPFTLFPTCQGHEKPNITSKWPIQKDVYVISFHDRKQSKVIYHPSWHHVQFGLKYTKVNNDNIRIHICCLFAFDLIPNFCRICAPTPLAADLRPLLPSSFAVP